MRKDVKLGLAIGAIFLAVVIVWAAIPKKPKPTGVTLNTSKTPPGAGASAMPQGYPPADSSPQFPTPAPDESHPTPAPDTGGTSGAVAPKPNPDKTAPDWATLLRASDDQLPALIGQSRAAAETADRPTLTPDSPSSPGLAPADPQGHGGMTTDTGLTDSTTRPAAESTGARTHTVQPGETLASIAKSVYGRSGMYLAIEKANPTVNPNRLRVGTVLKLPAASALRPGAAGGSAASDTNDTTTHHTRTAAVDSTTQYRVQPGDSLHKIAVKLYGNAARADELYTTNKDLIGPDPAKLKVGQILKLPEPPTASASR